MINSKKQTANKKLFRILAAAIMISAAGLGIQNAENAQAATFTAQQVATHNTISDCWLIISGNVYNVTSFIPVHPGGNAIVPFCGQDATVPFNSIHNSSAFALLPTFLIGVLASPLTAPSQLSAVLAPTTVALSWTGSTGGVSPITYAILRDGTSVGTTTATTFTDAGLTASTIYSYVISATDSSTPTPNTMSSTAFPVTTLAASSGDTVAPSVPTGLTATPISASQINLSWAASTDNVGVAGYQVFRNGIDVGTTTAPSFSDVDLQASTTYSYAVDAFDAAGNFSAQSAAVSATTLGNSTQPGGEIEETAEVEHVNVSSTESETSNQNSSTTEIEHAHASSIPAEIETTSS